MMSDPFALAQKAINKAFDKVNKATGQETDPDLQLYGTLKPQHFQELMKVYGEGPIIQYIQDMESKKIMNNRGGM
jgi:hypothetical protein